MCLGFGVDVFGVWGIELGGYLWEVPLEGVASVTFLSGFP